MVYDNETKQRGNHGWVMIGDKLPGSLLVRCPHLAPLWFLFCSSWLPAVKGRKGVGDGGDDEPCFAALCFPQLLVAGGDKRRRKVVRVGVKKSMVVVDEAPSSSLELTLSAAEKGRRRWRTKLKPAVSDDQRKWLKVNLISPCTQEARGSLLPPCGWLSVSCSPVCGCTVVVFVDWWSPATVYEEVNVAGDGV